MIIVMKNGRWPTYQDWIAVSVRWIAILGMLVSLALHPPISSLALSLLGLAAAWNVLLTVLVVLRRSINKLRIWSVAADIATASILFYLTSGANGSLLWSGVLPLITAAVYFQIKGTLIVTATNLLLQGAIAWFYNPASATLIYLTILLPLYLALGGILSYFSDRITQSQRFARDKTVPVRQEKEQIEKEKRRTIYNLISALSASLNYERVLETAMDLSADALKFSHARSNELVRAVLLFSENGDKQPVLYVGSARGFTQSDLRLTLPGRQGLLGQTIDEVQSRMTRNVAEDPELGRILALQSCESAYCIPLRTGLNTCGVLLYAHLDADFFTAENTEILDIIGHQVTIAIENARLYQDLEQEKERMMEIQEEARKKMARDLHDGPTQSVSAIAMRINFARRLLERDPKATMEELYKIEDLARRTTKEIRHMLFTLRPLVLESQGLIAALESMAEKMRETYSQNVIIQADPNLVDDLEMGKQTVIFYIAEEAVNNARKHAQARHIWVRLKLFREDLGLLEIEDDGVGFDPNEVNASYENRGSLGMINLSERAELINAVLNIDSAHGRGTRIRLAIPLTEEASDRIRRGS
jgi:signal transduction histidine kinase